MALVHHSLFPYFFENPPNGFHVIGIQSCVGIFEVHPASKPRQLFFPLGCVPENTFSALGVEGFHPHHFNVFATSEAKFFFNFVLHRKTVTVPTIRTRNVITPHGGVTRHRVFQGLAKNMPVVRKSVRKRRSIEKYELGFTKTLFYRTFENILTLPILDLLVFDFRK